MPQMTAEQGLGMWAGLFFGDAMGVPLEFTKSDPARPVTTLTSGGVHNAAVGEWSDDGAMALAIAQAYIDTGGFCGTSIMRNFIDWVEHLEPALVNPPGTSVSLSPEHYLGARSTPSPPTGAAPRLNTAVTDPL